MRLALRTGDYHVAVRRMARVLDSVSEYEIQPDLVGRAEALMAQMRRFNTRLSAPGHDELVERRALELLVSRLIDEARWRDHPLTSDPPDFWHTWLVFAQGNQRFEEMVAQADHPPAATDRTGMALARVRSALRASTRVGSAVADMSAEHSGNSDAADPMISEVRRAYLDQRRTNDGDGRAEEDAGIVLDFVVDFLGDRPMSSLSEREWFKIENALPDVPHPYGVPKEYTVSLHKRWQYAQAHGWGGLKRISKTHLKNGWHRSLHAFLTWAREKGFYAGPDYKFNLVSADNSEAQERDAWQPGEIVKLFSLPLFTGAKSKAWHWESGDVFVQNHLYWAYLLIFFAGLRPSEIGRTRLEDFALIEGVWYLDYRSKSERAKGASKVKKSASARLVPIPRLLIDLGLLDRRDALLGAGEDRLFPEWKVYVHKKSGREMWGHEFSKSWQYIKTKFGFTRENVTLYGGRHTRASWYDEAGIPRRIRLRLLGHKPTDVADTYGAVHITPEETALVFSKTNSVEEEVAEILITAKLRADFGELKTVTTWAS
ncbi:hypothetical protein ACFSX5_05320 [Devosia albogilva]|uniref:Tyr recombinase domain-containing protein n=1 Tax=Devosia albogilva TaxID=429726 RepID=A0ABW5QIP2_9HYPH